MDNSKDEKEMTEEMTEKMNENPGISTLIKNLRTHLGLSQVGFAKAINMSPTHISRFEKGIAIPSEKCLQTICDVFDVDKEYFSTDGGSERIAVSEAVKKGNFEESIAQRIIITRKEKGMSQSKLSAISNVDRTVINRVEHGAYLTEKQGRKLADALEVGYEWLTTGDESRKNYPADQRMINWLWNHEDVRKELWKRMANTNED